VESLRDRNKELKNILFRNNEEIAKLRNGNRDNFEKEENFEYRQNYEYQNNNTNNTNNNNGNFNGNSSIENDSNNGYYLNQTIKKEEHSKPPSNFYFIVI